MENNVKMLTETALRISGVNPKKCMKCGKCSGTCPSYDFMEYHPHQFVSMVENGQIEVLMESDSIYRCLSCMACVERCPRGVEPGKLVEAVRLMKISILLLIHDETTRKDTNVTSSQLSEICK